MLDHKCFSICNSNYCILLKFKFCKDSSQSFIYLLLLAQCTLLHYSSTRCPLLLETNSLKYCCCHDNCNFNKMYETFNAVVLTGTCYYIVVTKVLLGSHREYDVIIIISFLFQNLKYLYRNNHTISFSYISLAQCHNII